MDIQGTHYQHLRKHNNHTYDVYVVKALVFKRILKQNMTNKKNTVLSCLMCVLFVNEMHEHKIIDLGPQQ
jgi:hypothetical protein